mgnify:CR=1 FL=1
MSNLSAFMHANVEQIENYKFIPHERRRTCGHNTVPNGPQ